MFLGFLKYYKFSFIFIFPIILIIIIMLIKQVTRAKPITHRLKQKTGWWKNPIRTRKEGQ
jgi:hypothetical protein